LVFCDVKSSGKSTDIHTVSDALRDVRRALCPCRDE
jgi:hypothetical protein